MNKVKNEFIMVDIILLTKMKILWQKDMIVKEYTEEFYRLHIRSRHVDDEIEKVERYLNRLRSRIQNEISFVLANIWIWIQFQQIQVTQASIGQLAQVIIKQPLCLKKNQSPLVFNW